MVPEASCETEIVRNGGCQVVSGYVCNPGIFVLLFAVFPLCSPSLATYFSSLKSEQVIKTKICIFFGELIFKLCLHACLQGEYRHYFLFIQ